MNNRQYYVYIITNNLNTTMYTGVTNNIVRRIYEHKSGIIDGFSKKYNLKKLVYFEIFDNIEFAILREKQIKNYKRLKKAQLVNSRNPDWEDLYSSVT